MGIKEKIRNTLNSRERNKIDNQSGKLIHAAVLIPIFETNNEAKVLFTERTHKVTGP